MKSIAILNLKGGVGKTVTAVNMAAILAAEHKKKVVLIDCDSQCNATEFFGVNAEGCGTVTDILAGEAEPLVSDLLYKTPVAGLEMIPADSRLMHLDITALEQGIASKTALQDVVSALTEDGYDYVIFDCPPAFNAANIAALAAADEVIIPIKLDAFSLRGLDNLQAQVREMQQINKKLRIAGILICMWYRDKDIQDVEMQLRNLNPQTMPVFDTLIRRTPKVDKMTFTHRPITEYSPRSAAGKDYRAFVAEYLYEEALRNG